MPDYQITMPDGGKYKVTGPEGFTEQQAFQTVQGQLKSQSGTVPAQGSIMGDIGTGLARAAAGTYASLPDIGPRSQLKDPAQKFASEPATSTGQMVGEIAGNTLPYMLAPEIGAGRAALQYGLPIGITGYALYKAYEKRGVEGIVEAALAAGLSRSALGKYLPNLLAAARQHAGQIAQMVGGALEKTSLGAATTAARSKGASSNENQ